MEIFSCSAKKGGTCSDRRADLGKDPGQVADMFNAVAPRYDLTNQVLSMGLLAVWRRATKSAVDPKRGQLILDVAAGTGASSAHLMKSGADVVALDLSQGMLDVGRRRHPEINFVLGSATDLPFEDETFDTVTISYGIRNVDAVLDALKEFYRVTKPGGRLVVCEFSTPMGPMRFACKFYTSKVAPMLGKLASPAKSAYEYLTESIDDWHSQIEFGTLMKNAGWRGIQYRNLTFGTVALHRGYKNV